MTDEQVAAVRSTGLKDSENHIFQRRRGKLLVQRHLTSDQWNQPGIQSSFSASKSGALPATLHGLQRDALLPPFDCAQSLLCSESTSMASCGSQLEQKTEMRGKGKEAGQHISPGAHWL